MDTLGASDASGTDDRERTEEGLFGLFREGMLLARETADCLDGLVRRLHVLDVGEQRAANEAAIRLTAQVRALASWLLLQRAASRGEIAGDEAAAAQRDMRFPAMEACADPAVPARIRALIAGANALQQRILRIQAEMEREAAGAPPNAVGRQIAALRQALNAL